VFPLAEGRRKTLPRTRRKDPRGQDITLPKAREIAGPSITTVAEPTFCAARRSRPWADIGRFRTVDVRDLARFVHCGNESGLKHDLANLRAQELVEEKTLFRAHRSARKLVTLTSEGQRIVRKASGLPKEQRIYFGFVKPKELDHDADLYKVYQKAAEEIRAKGGKSVRVRLDFELKESINRAKEAAGRLPEDERTKLLATVAEEQGLTFFPVVPGEKFQVLSLGLAVPRFVFNLDIGKVDGPVVDGIRGKAAAGFRIFARSGDASRVRRALHDTSMVREVLSV
jgi:hypothetical protein